MSDSLFQRIERQNVNAIHKAEQELEGVNTRIAVLLTRLVGTMPTAYAFTVLALLGLFGLLGWLNPFVFLLATWVSQQFLQLVFLPILSVGQNVLNRKVELQADAQFSDIEHILSHLDAQDNKLIEMHEMIVKLLEVKQ